MNTFTINTQLFASILVFSRALLLCGLMAAPTFAHSDVLLAEVGGQVAIGAAEDLDMEEGGPFFDLETRVFEGVMVAGNPVLPFNFDYERDEPGFSAQPTSVVPGSNPLPVNAAVSIATANVNFAGLLGNLFYWDGTGSPSFVTATSTQPNVVSTFDDPNFGITGPSGGMDDHPLFSINLPGAGTPANGVYVAAYTANVAGLAGSEPFYFVWLVDDLLVDGEAAEELEELLEAFENGGPEPIFGGKNFAFFEEGVEYVEATIPEPTSVVLAALALGAGWFIRKR